MRNIIGEAPSVGGVLLVVGLACLWPMMRAPFLGTVFPSSASGGARLLFDVMVIASGVCVLFELLPAVGARRGAVCSELPLAAGVTASLGAVFSVAASQAASFPVASLLGSVLLGTGFSTLSVAWAHALSGMPPRRARIACTLSFLLSFLFGLADFFPVVLAVVCVVMPVASGACLFACWGLGAFDVREIDAREEAPAPWAKLVRSAFALWALVGVVASGCVTSLWSFTVGYTMEPLLVLTYIESAVLASVLLLLELLAGREEAFALYGVAAVTLLMVAGVCLCVTFGVRSSLGAIATSRTCFEFCLWVAVMRMCEREPCAAGIPLVATFSVALVVGYLLPPLIGAGESAAGDAVMRASVAGLVVMVLGLMVAASVGIAFALRAGCASSRSRTQQPALPAEPQRDSNWQGAPDARAPAAALERDCGLTEREVEVALLVSHGNSVKRTAEIMCVAPSTVQSHMKSIYRKMGIHSKQELVDHVHGLAS